MNSTQNSLLNTQTRDIPLLSASDNKSGKSKIKRIVTISIVSMIVLTALILSIMGLIVQRKNGWFFKRGKGFVIKGSELIISGGNDIYGDFEISGYNKIETITVRMETLKNINSLTIKNNKILKTINVEGDFDPQAPVEHGAFLNVKKVVLSGKKVSNVVDNKIFPNLRSSLWETTHSTKQPP